MALKLEKVKCKRCGAEILTGSKSINGADKTRAKWAGICEDCFRPGELEQLMEDYSNEVFRGIAPEPACAGDGDD